MFVWRTYGTALGATAGGAIGLDNGIRPTDTGSEYHGVGFTTFACVRFRTYRTPLVFRQHRDREIDENCSSRFWDRIGPEFGHV
jgi:hypothetical protein